MCSHDRRRHGVQSCCRGLGLDVLYLKVFKRRGFGAGSLDLPGTYLAAVQYSTVRVVYKNEEGLSSSACMIGKLTPLPRRRAVRTACARPLPVACIPFLTKTLNGGLGHHQAISSVGRLVDGLLGSFSKPGGTRARADSRRVSGVQQPAAADHGCQSAAARRRHDGR